MKKLIIILSALITIAGCSKTSTSYSLIDKLNYNTYPEKIYGSTLSNYEDPYIIIYEYRQGNIIHENIINPVPYNQKLTFYPKEGAEYLVVCYKAHGWWEYMQRDEPQTRYNNAVIYLNEGKDTAITIDSSTSVSGKNPSK